MKKYLFVLTLFLLITPSIVNANSGHLKLLAVSDMENDVGGIAHLYLEIQDGTGRIFLDTFPLTKIDTQMSTRFAKEIACNFLEIDCSKKDFFYTIRSDSTIVGGPSAGSAIAILTTLLLNNQQVNESISITGTINSGGIIGPVSGLQAKINAAERNHLKKVLVPSLSNIQQNNTLNLTNQSIDIIEVSNLNEALYQFTGKDYQENHKELIIDPSYNELMGEISEILCNKTNSLIQQIQNQNLTDNPLFNSSLELLNNANNAINNSAYYPAASYCFGANIKLNNIFTKNLSSTEILAELNNLKSDISQFEQRISQKNINTINNIQTNIIVKERILDAKEHLDKGFEQIATNNLTKTSYSLAYSTERLFSAIVWSKFFDDKSKKIELNQVQIRNSCLNKISEAEERYQYVKLITSLEFDETKKELQTAHLYLQTEEYDLCLFKASKAKANLDVALNVIVISEDSIPELIENKLDAIEKQIIKETQRGFFPILGYSYYIYAKDLKETDPSSALIYTELALELSDLWPYFQQPSNYQNTKPLKSIINNLKPIQILIIGILIGILIMLGPILYQLKKQTHSKKFKKFKKNCPIKTAIKKIKSK